MNNDETHSTRILWDPTPRRYELHTAVSLGLCSVTEDNVDLSSVESNDYEEVLDEQKDPELDSDGSTYTESSLKDWSGESDSEVDDAIAEESIDEIRTQNRICSTIEDYDDGELVFSEADLTLWGGKKEHSCNDTKTDITGANKSMRRFTKSCLPCINLISQKKP